jgi:urease accessory protein
MRSERQAIPSTTATSTSLAEPAILDRLPTGEPGSTGSLRLVVAQVAGRTRIVGLECSGPVQVLRCQYLDPAATDIASVTIASPSGGVLQGDRLRIAVEVRRGARLALDTQSATRLYRMPDRSARIDVCFHVGPDAWLEYVPEPYIPFAGSNTTVDTEVVVDERARVVIGEVVAAGRVARGELFDMTAFRSSVTAIRPSGDLLFSDATIFEDDEPLGSAGMMGSGVALGGLYVLAAGIDPHLLRMAIRDHAPATARGGASTLPNDAGAWLRVVALDRAGAQAVLAAGHDAARSAALGTATPQSRRL